MEFTQESIDALVVNEVDIMKKIAEELNIRVAQVSAVISLEIGRASCRERV